MRYRLIVYIPAGVRLGNTNATHERTEVHYFEAPNADAAETIAAGIAHNFAWSMYRD